MADEPNLVLAERLLADFRYDAEIMLEDVLHHVTDRPAMRERFRPVHQESLRFFCSREYRPLNNPSRRKFELACAALGLEHGLSL